MDISNPHNLRRPVTPPEALRHGIRVSLPPGDTFNLVLGRDWHREHWFASTAERDAALREMGKRHAFSRIGDTPSIVLQPIER